MNDSHICEECGKKEYPTFTDEMKKKYWHGITLCGGLCPLCGKKATLIPRRDFNVFLNEVDPD